MKQILVNECQYCPYAKIYRGEKYLCTLLGGMDIEPMSIDKACPLDDAPEVKKRYK